MGSEEKRRREKKGKVRKLKKRTSSSQHSIPCEHQFLPAPKFYRKQARARKIQIWHRGSCVNQTLRNTWVFIERANLRNYAKNKQKKLFIYLFTNSPRLVEFSQHWDSPTDLETNFFI